jgi:hypothetical protein
MKVVYLLGDFLQFHRIQHPVWIRNIWLFLFRDTDHNRNLFCGYDMLSFLLNKIQHHIKFVPIVLLIILIYEISKIFHLPALIFILVLDCQSVI